MTTPLTTEQQRILMSALNPARVSHRDQSGRRLSYVEAFDIKATLVRLFGFGGFSSEVLEYRVEDIREVPRSKGDGVNYRATVSARLRLTIHQLGAVYTEAASSTQTNPDLGEALDFALKTCASDALKRCAINLGTQFGLSLYEDGKTSDIVRVVFAPGQEWPVKSQAERDSEVERQKDEMDEAQAVVERAFGKAGVAE